MEGYVIRTPNAKATWTLIGINLVIGLATIILQYADPEAFNWTIYSFAAIPLYTINGWEPHRLITSMFLHGGFIHLVLNMFALIIFGPDVERVVGRARFLLLYFISGLVADYAHAYFILQFLPYRQFLLAPSIGASGAIFGVMAAFAVLFPFRRLMIFMGFPIIAPAMVAIFIMAVLQFLYAFFTPFSQVAYAAHLGGLAAGLIITLIYKPSLRKLAPEF
ncbi:MAG: rhomboid family intramembrane serine protease [Nitrososphaerota archaeon]|nr:rhomboid family intramembrane serine protease [Nitrososphaerota archaeon]